MRKVSYLFSVAVAVLAASCATHHEVANLEGPGARRIYEASYDQVWRATLDATHRGDLEIISADRTSGYIATRQATAPPTAGDNLGVWVRAMDNGKTEVEVLDRTAGASRSRTRSLENSVQDAIAANIIGLPYPAGTAPRQTIIERGGTTTVIIPADGPVTMQQRRVDAIRAELADRNSALNRENDSARRDAIEREIDRLQMDLRTEERQLRDLKAVR